MTKRKPLDRFLDALGRLLVNSLRKSVDPGADVLAPDFDALCASVRVGDVILVEGTDWISNSVKYLTQSTWSHAALYCGKRQTETASLEFNHCLVEVNVGDGCVLVPLSKYRGRNLRICRPHLLNYKQCTEVAEFMIAKIGVQYDTRNIVDLARFLCPYPPVPARWRRRMLAIGSGDPTRAICSTLLALAFQRCGHPVLPSPTEAKLRGDTRHSRREAHHIRHHSLYVPRDFDLSPKFDVIKPRGFVDFRGR